MTDDKTGLRALLVLVLPLFVACSAGSSGGTGPTLGVGGAFGAGGTAGASPFGSGGSDSGGATGLPGGGGTAGATGLGGATTIGAGGGPYPYDLTTTFTWPETSRDGGAVSLCKPGHYVGTYSCEVTMHDAGVYALTGPVDLKLAESQNGEFLSVSGGTLKSAAGILALDASLIGQLNCQTGAFDGTLQNGTLSIPPFPPGGTFAGSLSASFAPSGPKLNGTWTLIGQAQFAGYICHGPWNAAWQAN